MKWFLICTTIALVVGIVLTSVLDLGFGEALVLGMFLGLFAGSISAFIERET